VLLTLSGAIGGMAYALLTPSVYVANAHVIVVPQSDADISTAVNYAQAYARIATEGQTLDAAATGSKGAISRRELQENVRASSSPDASVIEITASATTASRAADLANAVARGLQDTGNRRTSDTRVRLAIFNEATAPMDPAAPQPLVDIAVGAALGLLVGGLWVLTSAGRSTDFIERLQHAAGAMTADERRRIGRTVAPAVPNGMQTGDRLDGRDELDSTVDEDSLRRESIRQSEHSPQP